MATQVKKRHPALKHGAYSVTGLLPGESRAGFENLYLGLIAELHPDGPLEDEAVATITRLVWRKQNAATFSSSMRDEVNVHKMLANFEIEERLDGMIDRLLKRLWMLQASKYRPSTASAPRIPGPKEAA